MADMAATLAGALIAFAGTAVPQTIVEQGFKDVRFIRR